MKKRKKWKIEIKATTITVIKLSSKYHPMSEGSISTYIAEPN